jgi:hypothetical protein
MLLVATVAFKARVRAMGIRDRLTSYRSLWQNGHVERLIGSIRRECMDHVTYGTATRDRYWQIFEDLRAELGSDCLGALECYRLEGLHRTEALRMRTFGHQIARPF